MHSCSYDCRRFGALGSAIPHWLMCVCQISHAPIWSRIWPKGPPAAQYRADKDWQGPIRAKQADFGRKMSKTKSLRIGWPGGQKLS